MPDDTPHCTTLPRLSFLLAAVIGAFCACAGCEKEAPDGAAPGAVSRPAVTVEVPASNARMAERLQEIGESTDPTSLYYQNGRQAQEIRARLERAKSVNEKMTRRLELAVSLLRAGETTESLEYLDQLEAALRPQAREQGERILGPLQGVAYLRLGEQDNCIENHTVDSCLMPIKGEGVHRITRGSRSAVEVYTRLLEREPDDLGFRWLLNLAYMTLGEYPSGVPDRWLVPPSVFESDRDITRFRDAAAAAGVAETALSGGTIIEDFNGDGFLDIMASSWGITDQVRYFENDGQGSFTDRTNEAYLIGQVGGLNMTHADYDNDGDADVLILRGAWMGSFGEQPNSLLRNLGDGRFEDVTEEAGVLSFQPTQTAAWGDYDNDGWLDLFVGNETRGSKSRPCELYHNNGDGTFTNVASTVLPHTGFVKASSWGDYDNDGRIDLYLSQMFEPNVLFRNEGPAADGSWRFTDVTAAAGVDQPVKSFPTWFFDYDNDGWLDIMVGSFSDFGGEALTTVVADYLGLPSDGERTRLFRNSQDGTFEDVTKEAHADRALLAMGANFGDIDNDGYLDMYFGTGEPNLGTLVPNVMLRNDGGRRFEDVTTSGGFGNIQKGHGIAFGDLDNDGDQDIYAVMGGAFSGDVYQNILFENPGFGNQWVTLRPEGVKTNRSAVGARVRVVVDDANGGRRDIQRVVGTGASFGSSSLQLEVGLGDARRIDRVEIFWPVTGDTEVFRDVPMNSIVALEEGSGMARVIEAAPVEFGHDGMHHDHGSR